MAGATKSGLGVPAGAGERGSDAKDRREASRGIDETARDENEIDEIEDQPGGLGPDQRPPSDS